MRKLLLLLVLMFSLGSCTKDDLGNAASRNTVSDSETIEFEELTFLVNVKSNNDYLVVESIDSVSIFVNDLHWSVTNSETINTDLVDKNELGNMYVTDNKLNYLVIASQDIIQF